MSLDFAAEPVTHVAVTETRDRYGNTTRTEAAPATLSALVAGRSTDESADPRSPRLIVGLTLYLLDTSVVPGVADYFVVRGWRYEVDGEAHRWADMGVEVPVKRTGTAPEPPEPDEDEES